MTIILQKLRSRPYYTPKDTQSAILIGHTLNKRSVAAVSVDELKAARIVAGFHGWTVEIEQEPEPV